MAPVRTVHGAPSTAAVGTARAQLRSTGQGLRVLAVTPSKASRARSGLAMRPLCASVPPSPAPVSMPGASRNYFVFPPPIFPLTPIFGRKTYRYDVIPGQMWRFEQKQGIGLGLNVAVNVRMTVIKMKSGGLFVYAPIAPTAECLALLADLDAPVEYIVLPTTLFEHKLFMGPFQRRFPKAQIFVAPGQWSWPLNLPPSFFGIFRSQNLMDENRGAGLPFGDEFEVEILKPQPIGVSASVKFNEAAIFHKATRTLLVTDAVVHVSDYVPDVIEEANLLESGDDNNFVINALKVLNLFNIREKAKGRTSTSADLDKAGLVNLGWQRNTLQALYFGPNNLLDPQESWDAVTNRVLVAPVVTTLVYSNCPDDVDDWVQRVCRWNFKQIIPCHLDAPIQATPAEFRAAFDVLKEVPAEESSSAPTRPAPAFTLPFFNKGSSKRRPKGEYYPPEDVYLLRGVADFLKKAGIIFTDKNRPKTPMAQLRSRRE